MEGNFVMMMVKFKVGTSNQNDSYIGKSGTLSIDTDNSQLRIHDGSTAGGNRLVPGASFSDIQTQLDSLGIVDIDGLTVALAGKIAINQIGAVDGVTGLNPEGLVPTEQLPSFVEDVIVAADFESFPVVGEIGKLYVDGSTNVMWRWSGGQEQYNRIAANVSTSDELSEGQVNFFFTDERVRDSISAAGSLVYDPVTGDIALTDTLVSVNGETGVVTLDKSHFSLDSVENYGVASQVEAESATVSNKYVTPIRARNLFEHMGFVEDGEWKLEDGDIPPVMLQGVWTSKADGPGGRRYAGAASVDGKVYVMGGQTGTTIYAETWMYDPSLDSWTQKADMPGVNRTFACGTYNGKIYVQGGWNGDERMPSFWEYDPALDSWNTSLPDAPLIINSHSGTVSGDRFYISGGYSNGNLSTLFAFDFIAGTWTQLSSMPDLVRAHPFVSTDTKLYTLGGQDGGAATDIVYEYDIATDSWITLTNLPFGVATDHGGVLIDGVIYVYDDSGSSYDHFYSYDINSDTWSSMPTAPFDFLKNAAVCEVNGNMFVYSGYNNTGTDLNNTWLVS